MSALYRRYRPQDFDDVVGQAAVVRTLRNAIEHDRVRHAYLFAGPRGTGKTSLAKILAKSLNCLNAPGPTATPCKTCESCRTIHDATSLDVIELDAASNRGIDDIREIRERVAMRPVLGRRKVYILDEAHSLTTDASNALLKTLEEPPEHVVFVLCTTEPQKLLDTIKGRCQAFGFQRPAIDEIRAVLQRIADAEAITVDEDGIALIARSARGSFRDAVSTLDQLSTALGGSITGVEARVLLGIVPEQVLIDLVERVREGDAAAALRAIDELAEGGQDLGQLVTDMLGYLRILLLTHELGDVPLSAPVTAEVRSSIAAQARAIEPRLLTTLLDGLLAVLDELRDGGDPRLPLELVLVRASRPSVDRSIEAILRRLDQLELPGAREQQPRVGPASPDPAAAPPATPAETATAPPPAAAPPSAAAPPPAPVETAVELGELERIWRNEVIPALRERRPPLAANLEVAHPAALADGVLRLQFPSTRSFNKSYADTDANRGAIATAVATALGQRVRIILETVDAPAPVADPGNGSPRQETPVAAAEPSDRHAREDALVEGFITEFDAREIDEEEQ